MKKNFLTIIFGNLVFLVLFFSQIHSVYASVTIGTVDTGFKLTKICKDTSCAASGAINFKPTINGNTPGALPVTITDIGITGHAWGDEIGWVNMTPTGAGVIINPTTGALSGKAYANSGSWINFAPTYPGSGPQVGVTLVDNGSGSDFQGWAWVSGAHGGWMKFDCIGVGTCVKTDWRAIPYRTTYACSDGVDNDGDTLIDYPADPGCSSLSDTDETNTTPGGGGGGGGGGSGGGGSCVLPLVYSNGACINPNIALSQTQSVDIQNQCGPYLLKYIKLGAKNDPTEVRKLQTFLNNYEGEKLSIDGKYKKTDYDAVKRFQSKYSTDVLSPWSTQSSTGYVYKTTVTKINQIVCPKEPLVKPITTPIVQKTCPVFTKTHRIGSIGGDIEKIRNFLNKQFPELKLKKTLMYTKGMSNAVKLYQQTYYSDIIIPAGLSRVTGIWAEFSIKKANKIEGCAL
jgi:hypothetical protein